MVEPLTPHRARGRVLILATAGELRADDPLSNRGHISPRYPSGLSDRRLISAPAEIQRETALCWFHMNFDRFDIKVGGPYFGFAGRDGEAMGNIAGFGVGVFKPPTYDARQVLTNEFRDLMPDALIAAIVDGLSGQWERLDPPQRPQQPPADLPATILAELGRLREEVADLRNLPAGIGHNNPPADSNGFDPVELIRELEAEIQTPRPDAAAIKGKWDAVASWMTIATKPLIAGALSAIGGELWIHAHKALLVLETAHHVAKLIVVFTSAI